MTDSPEPGQRENSPFKKDIPQDFPDISRGAPQLKIFSGQDMDEYVATHMDRYEAARKRWTECTGEEWEKGADGEDTLPFFMMKCYKDNVVLVPRGRIGRQVYQNPRFCTLCVFSSLSVYASCFPGEGTDEVRLIPPHLISLFS